MPKCGNKPRDDIRIDRRQRRGASHPRPTLRRRAEAGAADCRLGLTLFFASTAYKQVRCAQVTALLALLALWAGDQVVAWYSMQEPMSVPGPAQKSVLRLPDTLASHQHKPDATPAFSLDHGWTQRWPAWRRPIPAADFHHQRFHEHQR